MIRRIKKPLFMGMCVVLLFSAAPLPSQAGIVTDAWYALFGPPGSAWFPGLTGGYRTANYYPGATRAGHYSGYPVYRPFTYSPFIYRRSQAFNAPCSPCGAIGGICGVRNCTSNCAVYYAPQTTQIVPTPQENSDVPKTYLEDKTPEPGPKYPPFESEDSKFEPKLKEKRFVPTRDSETGTSTGVNYGEFREPIQVKAKKVPVGAETPESVIRQRKPAPPTQPEEDDGKSSPSGNSGSKTEESQVEPLNLDHKLVGHSRPKRTRLMIRSRFGNPVIVRAQVGPNRDSTLTVQGTKLAENSR